MNLLRRIERHLDHHRIAQTRFGRDAAGDPRLVSDMRNGREPRCQLAQRVTAYMDGQDAGVHS
ncbi:hypothetical protein [Sphingobium boeckii]|uniref:Uncharacterized protein n=1 Tax=Sphingobium boeckii TaxID=1082345 RepID=A0A7W9AI53_9SPHN|nr:hypothetical protein [Sphingobium boeckii]MBB5686023.1 hypothetical protein [Sphingobium boeckii]